MVTLVSAMAADALAMQGTRPSAAMPLTCFSQKISVSAQDRLL